MTRGLPILFSGEMVRAILEGRKSQTRRVKKSDKPKYQVGDTLWVREEWRIIDWEIPYEQGFWATVQYGDMVQSDMIDLRLSGVDQCKIKRYMDQVMKDYPESRWRRAMFMPYWASRITLEVTGVRCENLSDITERDAKKEGVADAIEYMELWNKINGKKHPWSSNPEVWVYEFKVNETL